ncbi:MAG: hypothetical protein C9356_02670 [Oleiphilus sp.]|nr:MAG: hypothetical protein C9356_02670 [Oleiphilus sp.]
MLDSEQIHAELNRLGIRRSTVTDEPSYAYEHETNSGKYLYVKRRGNKDSRPMTKRPLVIHPENIEKRQQLDRIEGATFSWEKIKSTSYRCFPKDGVKSQYGYAADVGSIRALREVVSIIDPSISIDDASATQDDSVDNNSYDRHVDEHVLRAIKTRRGQKAFRDRLIERFSSRCCVTSSTCMPILEAAHVIPHAEETNYSATNGLLLRSDIHTLYDLNLLRIDGEGQIHLDESLAGSEYDQYQGSIISGDICATLADNLAQRFESVCAVAE